jgi:hypothetical protein
MERFFGNSNTESVKTNFKKDEEQDENQDKKPTDSGDLNEWNIVDETKREEKNSSYMDLLSSYSTQNVIVEILNNKLHTMSNKIDLILEKVISLESKVDMLEEKTIQSKMPETNLENFKLDDNLIYNNFDIKEIMRKIDDNDENMEKSDIKINESTQLYHNSILNTPQTSTPTHFNSGLPKIGTLNSNVSHLKFSYKNIPE